MHKKFRLHGFTACLSISAFCGCNTQSSPAAEASKSSATTATSTASASGKPRDAVTSASPASPSASPAASASSSSAAGGDDAHRTVGPFSGVIISSSLEADIQVGPSGPLELTGDDDTVHAVKTEVSGDVLTISLPSGSFHMNKPLKVRITMPQVTSLQAASSAIIVASGLATDQLRVDTASSATMTLSGTCKKLEMKAASAAKLDAGKLVCDEVKLDASSAAEATVDATASATGTASSASHVHVLGNPKQKKIDTSSAATVD